MTILNRPIDAVLNVIKVMSMSSLLLISFEVEWHSLRSDKLYQCQGYEYKLLVCHCNFGGEGGGGGVIVVGYNSISYKCSKNILARHDVQYYKRLECVFFLVLRMEWHSSLPDSSSAISGRESGRGSWPLEKNRSLLLSLD